MTFAALFDALPADFIRESIRPAMAEYAPQLAHVAVLARAHGFDQAETDRRIDEWLEQQRVVFADAVGDNMAEAMIDELRREYRDSLAELAARTAGGGTA